MDNDFGFNKCPRCHRYSIFSNECKSNLVKHDQYSFVAKCCCGHSDQIRTISINGKYFIDKFSRGVLDNTDNIDVFDNDMLTKCDHDDPDSICSYQHKFPIWSATSTSPSRLVHFKVGEPRYLYRNFPCNCGNEDPNLIRWAISGNLNGFSGILEWCLSYRDAVVIYNEMVPFLKSNDYITIEPYSVNGEHSLLYRNAQARCSIGDTILFRNTIIQKEHIEQLNNAYGLGWFVATVIGMIISDTTKLVIRIGENHKYVINLEDVAGVIKRSNYSHYINSFKALSLLGEKSDEVRYLKDFPMFLPLKKVNISLIKTMENRLSRKKFKRWLRRNLYRVFSK